MRNAAGKILLDLHKFSGCVTEDDLQELSEKTRNAIVKKLKTIHVEKNLNNKEDGIRAGNQANLDLDDPDLTESAEVTGTFGVLKPSYVTKEDNRQNLIGDKMSIIQEKSQSKDWQEKEVALKEMELLFKDTSLADDKVILEEQFL